MIPLKRIRGKVGRWLIIGFLVCLVGGASSFGILRHVIQSGLDEWGATARAAHPHPGDNVAALLDYVQSGSHTLRERNLAVWALGQARDSRALPVLESYYTGGECDHATRLCQSELEKAVKLCRGETPNLLCIRTP